MHKPLNFDSKRFSRVSPEAREFLSLALDKSPDTRPTAAQLLKHAWIQKTSDKIIEQHQDDHLKEVFKNLDSFSRFSKFQMMVLSILA